VFILYRKTAAATVPARKNKLPESIPIGWSFMTTGGGGDEYIYYNIILQIW